MAFDAVGFLDGLYGPTAPERAQHALPEPVQPLRRAAPGPRHDRRGGGLGIDVAGRLAESALGRFPVAATARDTRRAVCRCGSTRWRDVPIHGGASVWRDCGRCGWFVGFPVWYGRGP